MKWTLADVWGVLAFVLMVAGVSGLSWEVFREGGRLEQLLQGTWRQALGNPGTMLPIALGAVALFVVYRRGQLLVGKGHPFSDALVYVLMALGVYYLYQWLI